MLQTLQSFFVILALLVGINVQAQFTLLEETFDDSTLGQFTQISVIGDGETWRPSDFNDKFFAVMNGYNGGIQDNEDWLISPAMDMSLYLDEVLHFEHASNFSGPELQVLISTDYTGTGDPNSATWTDMSSSATWSGGGYEYVDSGDIDLSSFEGTAYVAFKYISSTTVEGKAHQVDGIMVTATTATTHVDNNELAEKISTPYVSNNSLNFTVSENTSDINISLCTIDGKIMPQYNTSNVSGNVSIPLGSLTNGMYVMIATSGNAVMSYKFVK